MRILTAVVTGIFAAVVLAMLAGFVFSGLGTVAACAALAGGLAAAWGAWWKTPSAAPGRLGWADWGMLTVFALVSLRAFLWVVGERGDEVFVLSPNNLGDMSLHLNFIRYLASGVPFWPESPILTGAPLTYPIGADLFNALLELCGVPTARGLVWAGLLGAALTAAALWRWGGAFGLAALLFNGGLAGFVLLKTGRFEDFQSELVWKNLFLSMFVTQRGLLFALPAGLLLLTSWREEFFRSGTRPVPRAVQVLLYGAMPLFSLHAFLFLSAVLAAIFLARPAARRTLWRFLALTVLPATAGVLLVTGNFFSSGGLHWAWGWLTAGEHGPSLARFAKDLGPVVVFGLATLVVAWRKGGEDRCFVTVAVAVFAFCAVVSLTRWEWDNMKLMMWSWLTLAPSLWALVLHPLPRAARAALCVVLFFSGAVSLLGGLDARHGYSIARRSELAAWQHALADVPVADRIAVMPDYNHPVILLGRKVTCGYDGHLWSYGLDYGEALRLTKGALAGDISWETAAPTLQASWAAVRATDRPDEAAGAFGTLYDLRGWLRPSPASQSLPPPPPRPVD
jgi:hypothetical protein